MEQSIMLLHREFGEAVQVIPSEATRGLVERVETRAWSLEQTVKPQERGAPQAGEEIVRHSSESRRAQDKEPADNSCNPYGELDVILDRNADDSMTLLDFNYLATPVLRPTTDWPLAKTGDSENRQILRESTFAVLNSEAHAAVINIPTNLTVS
jgi:hypothetical protein